MLGKFRMFADFLTALKKLMKSVCCQPYEQCNTSSWDSKCWMENEPEPITSRKRNDRNRTKVAYSIYQIDHLTSVVVARMVAFRRE